MISRENDQVEEKQMSSLERTKKLGDGGREIFNIFAISLQLFKKFTTFHNGLFIMRYHNVLNQFPTLMYERCKSYLSKFTTLALLLSRLPGWKLTSMFLEVLNTKIKREKTHSDSFDMIQQITN